MSIKDNWNKVDETCPACHQVTKRAKGITRQNMKRLLVPKLNANEAIITIIIILVLVIAWAYSVETQAAREWLKGMTSGNYDDCLFACNTKCGMYHMNEQNITNMSYVQNG